MRPQVTSVQNVLVHGSSRIYTVRIPFFTSIPLTGTLLDMNVTGMPSGNQGCVIAQLECSGECYGITAIRTDTNLTSPGGAGVYYCHRVANDYA